MRYADRIALAEKFCRQAFVNLPYLLRSRRIGCFVCGYIFIYDGTIETMPISLDDRCGMCPACDHFSLIGDATSDFTPDQLRACGALIRYWRTHRKAKPPRAIRWFIAVNFNTGKIRRCTMAYCRGCGWFFLPNPMMFYTGDGKIARSDAPFLCPRCLAPAVVAVKKKV